MITKAQIHHFGGEVRLQYFLSTVNNVDSLDSDDKYKILQYIKR